MKQFLSNIVSTYVKFSELMEGLFDVLAAIMAFVVVLYLVHVSPVPSQDETNIFLILSAVYLIIRAKKS
jgi:hypothetical protein